MDNLGFPARGFQKAAVPQELPRVPFFVNYAIENLLILMYKCSVVLK